MGVIQNPSLLFQAVLTFRLYQNVCIDPFGQFPWQPICSIPILMLELQFPYNYWVPYNPVLQSNITLSLW